MIELGDLITQPRLGLQLRARHDATATPLRWALPVEDLRDVEACRGDELVLTRARWRNGPTDADRFVCALAQRGVGAIALQPDSTRAVEDLSVACERWQVPLVTVLSSVRLEDVAEATITLALHRENAGGLRAQRRQRSLLDALGSAEAVGLLLGELADDLACETWLVTAATAVSGTGRPDLPDADLRVVARSVAGRRGAVELLADDGTPLLALPITGPHGRQLGHVVAERPGLDLSADERAAVHQVCQVLERHLHLERRHLAARRPLALEFLRRAASGTADAAELDAWARVLGMQPDGVVVALVGQLPRGTSEDVAALAEALEEMAAVHGVAAAVTVEGQEVAALLFGPSAAERLTTLVRRAELALGPAVTRAEGVVGTSSVMARSAADCVRILHEARRVCQLNALRAPEPEPADVRGDAPLAALLLMSNGDAMQALHDVMLAPLVRYDEQHDTELLRTLDVFLAHGGQWSAAAAALGVHVNTLRYRVARIEKCTGRDPADIGDRVDFYIALHGRGGRRAGVGEVDNGRPASRSFRQDRLPSEGDRGPVGGA